MWTEEEYFNDAKVIAICAVCDEELYQGFDAYYDSNADEYFCCEECVLKYYEIERVEL